MYFMYNKFNIDIEKKGIKKKIGIQRSEREQMRLKLFMANLFIESKMEIRDKY